MADISEELFGTAPKPAGKDITEELFAPQGRDITEELFAPDVDVPRAGPVAKSGLPKVLDQPISQSVGEATEAGLGAGTEAFMEVMRAPLQEFDVPEGSITGPVGESILNGLELAIRVPAAVEAGILEGFSAAGQKPAGRDLVNLARALSVESPFNPATLSGQSFSRTLLSQEQRLAAKRLRLESSVARRGGAEALELGQSQKALERAEKAKNEFLKGKARTPENLELANNIKKQALIRADETLRAASERLSQSDFQVAYADPELLTSVQLTSDTVKRVTGELVKELTTLGVIDPKLKLTPDNIGIALLNAIDQGALTNSEIVKVFDKANIGFEDFIALYGRSVSEGGRSLNALSQAKKALREMALAGNMAAAKILESQLSEVTEFFDQARKADDPFIVQRQAWQQMRDSFKLALVSQPVTAMRNMLDTTQYITMGAIGRAADASIARALNPARSALGMQPFDIHPIDMMGDFFGVFNSINKNSKTSQEIDRVFAAFPEAKERLFAAFQGDIGGRLDRPGKLKTLFNDIQTIPGATERVMIAFNVLNRAQEFMFRRGVFYASLDRRLQRQGSSIEALIETQDIPDGMNLLLKDSIDDALRSTFGARPDLKGGGLSDPFFNSYIKLINSMNLPLPGGQKLPIGPLIDAFPRFFFNSMKLITDYTPTGGLRLLDPKVRLQMSNGDFRAAGREIVGSSMLGVAIMARKGLIPGFTPSESNHAGFVGEEGEFDLRANFIMNAYMAMADFLVRMDEGRLNPQASARLRDAFENIFGNKTQLQQLSSFLSNGIGQALQAAAASGDLSRDWTREAFQFVGRQTGGIFNPLRAMTDFFGEFTDTLRIARDPQAQFLGEMDVGLTEFVASLPGTDAEAVTSRLAPRYSPLRSGPVVEPLVRIPFSSVLLPSIELTEPGLLPRRGEEPSDISITSGLMRQVTGLTFRDKPTFAEEELGRLGFSPRQIFPRVGSDFGNVIAKYGMSLYTSGMVENIANQSWYGELPIKAQQLVMNKVINVSKSLGFATVGDVSPSEFSKLKLGKKSRVDMEGLLALMPPSQRNKFKELVQGMQARAQQDINAFIQERNLEINRGLLPGS